MFRSGCIPTLSAATAGVKPDAAPLKQSPINSTIEPLTIPLRTWKQMLSLLSATISNVAVSPTKTVEFDSELLERLRQRRPEMGDRELLESMARMTLGRETLRRVQERSTLSEDEAIELGVKAVHEARRDRRAAG